MKKIRGIKSRGTAVLKRQSSLKVVGIFVLLFGVIGSVLLFRSFAAAPEVYLTPSTSTLEIGENVTVTLRVNPGQAIDGVESTITYDKTKLEFVSIDQTASAFTTPLVGTGGDGTVQIIRGSLSGTVSTDSEVAKITFKALAATVGSTNLQLAANATSAGVYINPSVTSASVTVSAPAQPASLTGSFSIESTNATPAQGSQFGLKVYATSNANIAGGEVKINLPAGLSYQEPLNTTGTAFNPVTTVTGTTSQLVYLVFTTQSQSLTGKQLVATIPVTGSTTGAKSVTISGQRIVDVNDVEITNVGGAAFSVTIGSPVSKPVVTRPGKTQLAASETITDYKQSFTITNYDASATYAITLGGQQITQANGAFSIPTSLHNGDHTLQVTVTKSGSSDNASYQIRLRSPNVNRSGCVELLDLLAVNKVYGTSNVEFDLNMDGTVSLVDLLTITSNWGGTCIE